MQYHRPTLQQPRRGTSSPSKTSSSSVALVLIDSSERRRKESRLYETKAKSLERQTIRLKAFEQQEIPDFTSWIEREFTSELREIRESHSAAASLHQFIEEVQTYARIKGMSDPAAYLILTEAKEDGTYRDLWLELVAAQEREQARERKKHQASEEFINSFKDAFRDFFDQDEGRNQGESPSDRYSHFSRESASESVEGQYLKTLYRQLVRELHPDMVGFSEERMQLWQEVQEAYAWGDCQRLERLSQHVTKERSATLNLKLVSIGDLIALRKSIESKLRKLRHNVREAKEHPAWNFLEVKKDKRSLLRLRNGAKVKIMDDLDCAFIRLARLEQVVEDWRTPIRNRKRRR